MNEQAAAEDLQAWVARSISFKHELQAKSQEPKRLMLYPGADHGLDEVAQEVHQVVRDWVIEKLNNVG